MRKTIHVDMLTPKQVRLMNAVYRALKNDYDFILTARHNAETVDLLRKLGLYGITKIIGKHGHTLEDKAEQRFHRQLELADQYYNQKAVDLLISFVSPSATQVAFAYDVPIIMLNDTPWSVIASKLTLPYSTHFICSKAFQSNNPFLQYLLGSPVSYFDGVDEVTWVKNWTKQFHHKPQEPPLITIRVPEYYSSYTDHCYPIMEDILTTLEKLHQCFQVQILTRNESLEFPSMKYLEVTTTDFDFPLQIYQKSSGFIGIGGTMNREAAMLGIPSLSLVYFRYVNPYIKDKGFPLYSRGPQTLFTSIKNFVLTMKYDLHSPLKHIIQNMESPIPLIKKIANNILNKER